MSSQADAPEFALNSVGTARPRGDSFKMLGTRQWRTLNAIFISQLVSAWISLFMALSALSEILGSEFMSTQTWWIIALVQFAWTTTAMFPAFLAKNLARSATTDLANEHIYPFTMYIITSAFIDCIIAVMLIAFHHKRDGTIIISFNASRNDSSVTFDGRIVSAWYAMMTLVIAASWAKLQLMVESYRRHLIPVFKDVNHP